MQTSQDLKSLKSLDIILASEAQWRSDILNQVGIFHRCAAHQYDEPEFETGSLIEFVKEIAAKKGLSLQKDNESSMIISADQLITLDDDVFYKSGSRENAINQLTKLNGKKHKLICAVAVVWHNKLYVECEEAYLKMRNLSAREINYYVDVDKPWDCAGSYKIESLGASLFEEIDVKDPTTIIGIPANLLINIIRKLGFSNLV